MNLKELIELASKESPEFVTKYNYWMKAHKRYPDLEWTMKWLEKILGKEVVENAAQTEIERQEELGLHHQESEKL